MKKIVFFIYALFVFGFLSGQENSVKSVDSLYREDQLYVGITYNLLANKPSGVSQTGFSTGVLFGFIRDMPINKNRDLAIGLGLGYSVNSFNQNILIDKDESGHIVYSILSDNSTYIKNKFYNHLVELPLEFRWRTSTPEDYSFWRIYTGLKLSYAFASLAKYDGDLGFLKNTNIGDFNILHYGLTLSVGYNTWSFYLYYALNPIFPEDVKLEGNTMEMNSVKIGLIFYIL